jgi:penicillin-binding protein 1C
VSTPHTQNRPPRLLRGMLTAAAVVVGLMGLGATSYGLAVVRDIAAALPATPDAATLPVSASVVDRHGQLLRPFTTADGRWRLPVTAGEVDKHFIDMLVAYEDQNFSTHKGIDWGAMLRASGQYATAGRIVSGGSTLTMQVARLIEGEPTRNIWGKLRQIVHADALEHELSKDADPRSLSHARALWRQYRRRPRGKPNLLRQGAGTADDGRSALLVALPQSPEARRPDRDPRAAEAARAHGARPHGERGRHRGGGSCGGAARADPHGAQGLPDARRALSPKKPCGRSPPCARWS